MENVIQKIIDLYKSPNGNSGGYGHIVFDDGNIETKFIEWCIKEAEIGEYDWICEETRKKSIIALKSILPFSEEDREVLINYAFEQMENQ
jgi:hypothetical protein